MEIIVKGLFILLGMSGAIICAYKAGFDNGYFSRVGEEVSARLKARINNAGIDSNIRSE